MKWSDEALVLGGRRFGEGGLILDVLTKTKGRQAGLVYGGASRKRRAHYEPGNTLAVSWSGRLDSQLGRFDVAEPIKERATRLLDDPTALAVVSSVSAILRATLNEGDAAGSSLYEPSLVLLDQLGVDTLWPALYVRWEAGLLASLGFGMDLSHCALSGANDGLTHVSPRTGRAVRGSDAEAYLDRLFPLPKFLIDPLAPIGPQDLANGLALTGYFVETRLFHAMNKSMPQPRIRLAQRFA